MNIIANIAIWIIIIEVSLVLIILITTYLLRILSFIKHKLKIKHKKNITHYLSQTINFNAQLYYKKFPNRWRKIELLIPIIKNLDMDSTNLNWEKNRIHFIKSILLPLARKVTFSNNWTLRYFAAEAFALLTEKTDESYIIKLCSDEVPLVSYYALRAAILCESESAINLIITQMLDNTWINQSLHLSEFNKVAINTRKYIEARLKTSSDSKLRYTCYRILLKYPPVKANWDIKPDIESNNLNLKMSALRFLTHTDRDTAIPLLLHLLKDENWKIQSLSIDCLGKANAIETIPEIIPYLNNPNRWIQLVAAQTMFVLGEKGKQALKAHKIRMDKISYKVTQHILEMEE